MKTLRIKSRPLSAAAYLEKCNHARTIKANRLEDIWFEIYCRGMAAVALVLACIAVGGVVQILCILSK